MSNLARTIDWQRAASEAGVVMRADGREVWIAGARGTVCAERAASCLVAPEPDDLVLYCVLASGVAFVLAVLARGPGKKLRIAPEGDLQIDLATGRLCITARDGASLASGKEASLAAEEVRVVAARATLAVSALSYLGRCIDADLERVRLVAEAVDTVAGRVMERVKHAFRFIEQLDVKRAYRVDHATERDYHLRAENAILTAAELVKLDGQQIHLG